MSFWCAECGILISIEMWMRSYVRVDRRGALVHLFVQALDQRLVCLCGCPHFVYRPYSRRGTQEGQVGRPPKESQ